MHPIIFLVLIFPLFSGGDSLMCYECKNMKGSCVGEPLLCTSGTMCSSTILTTSLFDNTAMNMSMKGCIEPEMCGSISINYGITRTVISVQCCNTDLCNTQDEQDHTSNSPNGKQCYYCDENQNCLNKLNCLEHEDYCITTKDTTEALLRTVKGCASKSICDALPYINERSKDTSCCKGNLCNSEENLRKSEKKLHDIKKILNLGNNKFYLWDSENNVWEREDNLWEREDNLWEREDL